jgi:hypothetical protein
MRELLATQEQSQEWLCYEKREKFGSRQDVGATKVSNMCYEKLFCWRTASEGGPYKEIRGLRTSGGGVGAEMGEEGAVSTG